MAAKVKNAQTAAAKWARNLQAAGQSITDGVNSVTVAPGQLAAQQMGTWLANVTASAPRWQQAVASVSLQSWQTSMIQKGVPRITAAAPQAQPKVQAFLESWLQYEQQVTSNLPPRGSLEQNIQRAAEMARQNAAAKGRFRQAGRSR